MKKGFTLIELLGVLVVIAAIGLVTVPVVSFILDDSKNKAYDSQVKIIIAAANNYALDNIDDINKPIDYVGVDELQKGGYLEKKDVISAETNQPENGCVIIKYDNNKFKFNYNKKTCSEVNKDNAPTIVIEDHIIKVEVGSNYDVNNISVSGKSHSGASLTVDGPIITKNGKVVTFDTSILNAKYILTYSTIDPSNNLTTKDKIKIIIKDETAPVIKVNNISGPQTVNIKLNDRYDIPECAVTDNSGESIECAVSGSVNTEVVGNNVITYYAADSSGNKATYTLNVNVVE